MVYFADEVALDGRRELSQVLFEFYGARHRLSLYRPSSVPADWTLLESILGQEIER